MDPKIIFNVAVASGALAAISLIVNFVLITNLRRMRRDWIEAAGRFDEELTSQSQDLDTASRQAGEHARRIAWLESRARYAQQPEQKVENEKPLQQKVTITERRHRVMSLARRGQDINTIARTLGMNHGEVELMINLGRAA